jgi:chromate reductase, NAD(P)H dehydrogenase (quinone)
METPIRILGIAGSLRRGSYNRAALRAATELAPKGAILFVTPEYNWSVSGVLKNAIDWASRPHGDSAWNGKPAAIMGASTGAIGTARAQNHPPRRVLVYLNMFPINQPEVLISHAMDRFDQEGNLIDAPTTEHIIGLLQNLVDWAGTSDRDETRGAIPSLQILTGLPSKLY